MLKKTIAYSLILLVFNCSGFKTIKFSEYIDTSNREVKKQSKKTYQLENIDVFASNEFDGARLNDFIKVNDSSAIAYISPENTPINNSPYYAFKIWSKKTKEFYITFKYPKNFTHRYNPKLKIDNNWKAVDPLNITEKDGLTTMKIILTTDPQIIAAQNIESSKSVKKWCSEIEQLNTDRATYFEFGTSTLNKQLASLEINNGKTENKDVVILFTRQHPPEVTGYYAFQNFIETILKKSKLSSTFLENYQILAFPLLNPDGVDLGHWRHNANGVDLNRDWSKYNQKEIKKTVRYISKYLKKNNSKIVLGLDFHSTWYDIFYTNKERKNTTLPKFIGDWFISLEENIQNFKIKEASQNSKKPVSKGWFLKGHNAVGITFEIGDETTKENIKKISETGAIQMMKILVKEKAKRNN